MRISLNWLKDFVKINKTPEELSDLISAKLTEVEGFVDQKKLYDGIIAVKIEELKKHPNSDHLWLVKVNTGHEILDIVCGAQNLAVDQIVPLIPVGATVPDTDDVLKTAVIRGEKSQGMLASVRELKLGDDHSGIYILNDKIKPGTPLSEALSLDDVIFEIENKALTHRGDCFSVAGIAREVAAITTEKFIEPDYNAVKGTSSDHKIALTIQNQVDCPRYLACHLSNVKVAPSPEYVTRRLINSGIRPINNVVQKITKAFGT
ncbi:MAG: phenylalanine--tRNA ligase beta subunit-related protein [candidate division WWE3 bacterium]|nr:phenylalanine--tRNA ligase beta subunit-related protein [candidate division WWE3 bacterium]